MRAAKERPEVGDGRAECRRTSLRSHEREHLPQALPLLFDLDDRFAVVRVDPLLPGHPHLHATHEPHRGSARLVNEALTCREPIRATWSATAALRPIRPGLVMRWSRCSSW